MDSPRQVTVQSWEDFSVRPVTGDGYALLDDFHDRYALAAWICGPSRAYCVLGGPAPQHFREYDCDGTLIRERPSTQSEDDELLDDCDEALRDLGIPARPRDRRFFIDRVPGLDAESFWKLIDELAISFISAQRPYGTMWAPQPADHYRAMSYAVAKVLDEGVRAS